MGRVIACGLVLILASCAGQPVRRSIGTDVQVRDLGDGVWMIITIGKTPEGRISSSNGLVVGADDSLVVVDPGWTTQQGSAIKRWAQGHFGRRVDAVVATSASPRRTGGLGAFVRPTPPLHLQRKAHALMPPDAVKQEGFGTSRWLRIGAHPVLVFYPGDGYAPGNTVVWIPHAQILFAGDLLVPADAIELPPTANLDANAWAQAVLTLRRTFPSPLLTIPGHGEPGSVALFDQTIKLLGKPASFLE